jgi:hypothetical protein
LRLIFELAFDGTVECLQEQALDPAIGFGGARSKFARDLLGLGDNRIVVHDIVDQPGRQRGVGIHRFREQEKPPGAGDPDAPRHRRRRAAVRREANPGKCRGNARRFADHHQITRGHQRNAATRDVALHGHDDRRAHADHPHDGRMQVRRPRFDRHRQCGATRRKRRQVATDTEQSSARGNQNRTYIITLAQLRHAKAELAAEVAVDRVAAVGLIENDMREATFDRALEARCCDCQPHCVSPRRSNLVGTEAVRIYRSAGFFVIEAMSGRPAFLFLARGRLNGLPRPLPVIRR